jgi:dUTP pyrophosphatase
MTLVFPPMVLIRPLDLTYTLILAMNTPVCVFSQRPLTLRPHTTVKIGTGWAIQPPEGYCGLIFARSGLATKEGLRPANCVGICDEDYTGEYIVALHNDTDVAQVIYHGERIAQLVFMPYEQVSLIEVEELDPTERGDGGFGHTGK